MYGVVDVDVDIVQKVVILVPVSAPFALKTLELIINNRPTKSPASRRRLLHFGAISRSPATSLKSPASL